MDRRNTLVFAAQVGEATHGMEMGDNVSEVEVNMVVVDKQTQDWQSVGIGNTEATYPTMD